MPPDRGRASKACATCRKIKTRCYEAETTGNACLRCDRLGQSCSLAIAVGNTGPAQNFDRHRGPNLEQGDGYASRDDRLSRLERTVSALVERLDRGSQTQTQGELDSSDTSQNNPPWARSATPGSPSAAPVLLIRNVASEVGLHREQVGDAFVNAKQTLPDVISKGLIQPQEASSLIELFQEHYGRWVSFNATLPSDILLSMVRQSPLLLCACCLIAVRHTTQERVSQLAPFLFQDAKSLLSSSLLDIPQSIQFFQASVVLCMWSTTIGQTPLSVDSWLLSGFALQQSLAAEIFGSVSETNQSKMLSKGELDRWCIWNHLCLVHLHYCVGTRRRAILDRAQIDKCRKILDSDHATNFETRMVAEINLYWIIYQSCSTLPVDLPQTQAALHQWRQEWKFLFDQPRSQFIQMGYYFAQLLVYDQALKYRSAAVRESLLLEMIRLSVATMQLALDTSDERTRHLSDHIYHMITFAAVTLCRLLHMYENQVAKSQNVMELDTLVLTLVTWLHSIGLPSHVAHTLGDVVAAFHKKLRPSVHPRPYDEISDDIGLYFPELLGMETFDGGILDFFPDWEAYTQGPLT